MSQQPAPDNDVGPANTLPADTPERAAEQVLIYCSCHVLRMYCHETMACYCVLAALASACTAACEVMLEFMNFEITSNIAPWAAELIAMPCAMLGSSVLALLAAAKSSIDLVAQLSNLVRGTSGRTGIEPLFRLKTS